MSNKDRPMIKGLDLSEEEAKTYRQNYIEFYHTKQLVRPIVPIIGISTPSYCNYRCIYCVTSSGESTFSELNEEEVEKILDTRLELGAKTIEIAGAGEPTLWPGLKPLVYKAHKKGYTIVLFTNNSIISQDNELLEFFYEHDVSLIIKYHSLNHYIHNLLTGRKDANEHKERAFQKIIDLGYNKDIPTRIGIETIITNLNLSEIPNLWRFARDNNLFPFFETIHHTGRAKDTILPLDISYEVMTELFNGISNLDYREYGYKWEAKPPYIGFDCTVSEHIHIDERGNVLPCFEFTTIEGNIRKEDLVSILKRSELLYNIRKLKEQADKSLTCRDE